MGHRGYQHASPLEERYATGSAVQSDFVDDPDAQLAILRAKGCACAVPTTGEDRAGPTGSSASR